MPYRKHLPRPFRVCLASSVRFTHRVKYRHRSGSRENLVKSLNSFTQPSKFRRGSARKVRETRRARIRSLRARIHRRLRTASITTTSGSSGRHKRSSQASRKKVDRARRAKIRSLGARVRQRICSVEEPEKKITQSDTDGIWIGNQDDPQILKEMNITRVFHLDRKTIVLQPHENKATSHIPQLSFYEAYDYDRNDFLKDLEELCRIIHVELLLDKQILIYLSQAPSKEESSRVRALTLAYRIYTGHKGTCYNCMVRTRKSKTFKGLKKPHFEQLLVWTVLTEQPEVWRRESIYRWWCYDYKGKSKWIGWMRERARDDGGFRRGYIYSQYTEENGCLVM